MKTYRQLITLNTFEDRFEYLKLRGKVGEDTFGFDRYYNQKFYKSKEWKDIRNFVIARDNGCDLGVEDREIFGKILIHHMNPISLNDIRNSTDYLLNPEYLICVSKQTHDAIHYGDSSLLISSEPTIRKPDDTVLWR